METQTTEKLDQILTGEHIRNVLLPKLKIPGYDTYSLLKYCYFASNLILGFHKCLTYRKLNKFNVRFVSLCNQIILICIQNLPNKYNLDKIKSQNRLKAVYSNFENFNSVIPYIEFYAKGLLENADSLKMPKTNRYKCMNLSFNIKMHINQI